MKTEVSALRIILVSSLQKSVTEYVSMTFDPFKFDHKIYRRLPFIVLPLCMKSLGWKIFAVSRHNKVWTDWRTDEVNTIGLHIFDGGP